MKPVKKLLIANRGEIAVRIIQTARKMGIHTIAVFSEQDRNALHTSRAHNSWSLGEGNIRETYLDIDKIMNIAKESQADAIHPGYGFLAENPDFATACQEYGITFIGPSAEAIRVMGNKTEAADEAVQIFGGYGLIGENDIERFYRDQRILQIGEGTSEVLRWLISKKIGV
ncbi:MAG: biotin carboxylase N-terminal domain-containing protein [Bacteroidales bacterium]